MLKKSTVFISTIVMAVMLVFSSFSAFAMGPTKDGVYKVPIEMWHSEKDRTSMGDSYIVHTALLTVDGDEKSLTIAPTETTSDMQFWYYEDGSTEGNTVEVEQKKDVEIDGTSYATAFEFPIESSDEFVGVKFAASAMPLSPSARIKIDYDNATRIGDVPEETTTETTTTTTTSATTVEATEEVLAETQSAGTNRTPIIIGAVAGVVIIAVVTVIIIKKKSN